MTHQEIEGEKAAPDQSNMKWNTLLKDTKHYLVLKSNPQLYGYEP